VRKIKAYYGSRISTNMVRTPEGYLICKNVPIGRTGWMDYLGEELGLDNMRGKIIKVYRSPEELFSKATIASFEGKSVTNNHPSENLTLDTVGALERGHIENARQDGDFLIADLYMKDAGLINEVENNMKREVSCGYDCRWIPMDDSGTRYEQKEIVGNHVAVVQNGRAGSRVAIKDSKPNNVGGKKIMAGKITKSILTAMGFKAYIQDAEPEDVAKAMDALNEGNSDNGNGGGGEPTPTQNQDDDTSKQILQAITNIGESIKGLTDRVTALESAKDEEPKKDAADEELEGLEKEIKDESGEKEEKEVQDDDAEVVEAHDDEPEDKTTANDTAGYLKLIQDMKPVIMGIPDEKTRNEVAKQFTKSVRDSRASSGANGYKDIINTTFKNKKTLMDSANKQMMTREQATQKTADAWNKQNAFYKGGN
jgi:hypothetical protein